MLNLAKGRNVDTKSYSATNTHFSRTKYVYVYIFLTAIGGNFISFRRGKKNLCLSFYIVQDMLIWYGRAMNRVEKKNVIPFHFWYRFRLPAAKLNHDEQWKHFRYGSITIPGNTQFNETLKNPRFEIKSNWIFVYFVQDILKTFAASVALLACILYVCLFCFVFLILRFSFGLSVRFATNLGYSFFFSRLLFLFTFLFRFFFGSFSLSLSLVTFRLSCFRFLLFFFFGHVRCNLSS